MRAECVEQGVFVRLGALDRLLVLRQRVVEPARRFETFAQAVVSVGAVRVVADVGLEVLSASSI